VKWFSDAVWAGVLLLTGVALWCAIIELFRPPKVNLLWTIDRDMDYRADRCFGNEMVDVRCGRTLVIYHIASWKAEKLVAWHNVAVVRGRLATKEDMPKREWVDMSRKGEADDA